MVGTHGLFLPPRSSKFDGHKIKVGPARWLSESKHLPGKPDPQNLQEERTNSQKPFSDLHTYPVACAHSLINTHNDNK